jgi:hypothetical protein
VLAGTVDAIAEEALTYDERGSLVSGFGKHARRILACSNNEDREMVDRGVCIPSPKLNVRCSRTCEAFMA